ncbi:MAG: metallophosphoesterase [Schwartzia sp.]|nr:metallophosphoesterase [Schwartzia sp. (in: firmicutes)]
MLFFWLILLTVLSVVAGLAWWAMGAVVPGGRLSKYRGGLLFLDVVSIALLLAGPRLPLPVEAQRSGLILLSIFWMTQLIFGVLVALLRMVRFVLQRQPEEPDAERRRLLRGAALYPLLAAAAGAYGGLVERTAIVVREIPVPLPGIGPEMEGFRIAQISDIHLGLFFHLDDLKQLLEQAAATGAAALAITGDLFDDDAQNEDAAVLVDRYTGRFPHGIWFCYGNHEHFRNLRRTKAALTRTSIRVLENENVRLLDGTRPLYFAGVDYPFPRTAFEEKEKDFTARALGDLPPSAVTVLLAHHPDFIDDAAARKTALVLTGHTHGGQIGFLGVPLVPPVFKYMRGLYRVGDTLGYVHPGNGSWFPFRLGCPPEIAVFTLKSP